MLILTSLLFIYFLISVLPAEAARSREILGSAPTPDTSFIYTAQDLRTMAESYGEAGRAYYVRSRYTFDLLWPLVYASFLTVAITTVFSRVHLPRILTLANLLPLAAADFDFLENLLAGLYMHRFPRGPEFLAALAPVATFVKWVLVAASFAALLVGLFMLVLQVLGRRLRGAAADRMDESR